jgi:hypothetical protein
MHNAVSSCRLKGGRIKACGEPTRGAEDRIRVSADYVLVSGFAAAHLHLPGVAHRTDELVVCKFHLILRKLGQARAVQLGSTLTAGRVRGLVNRVTTNRAQVFRGG